MIKARITLTAEVSADTYEGLVRDLADAIAAVENAALDFCDDVETAITEMPGVGATEEVVWRIHGEGAR